MKCQAERGQKMYDFTHLWDVKQNLTNEVIRQTERNDAGSRKVVTAEKGVCVGGGKR